MWFKINVALMNLDITKNNPIKMNKSYFLSTLVFLLLSSDCSAVSRNIFETFRIVFFSSFT